MESLFSFEFYVDRIAEVTVPCTTPAIGFRFIDYPTVVVQCSLPVPCGEDNAASKTVGKYEFNFAKGKSCLFRNNLESLSKLLSEIPLYIMLFDSTHQTSKLIGCCSIPLINLITRVNKEVKLLGTGSPTVALENGQYEIYDLMGSVTGKIRLRLKLNFYGTSVNKYITHGKDIPSFNVFLDLNGNKCEESSVHGHRSIDVATSPILNNEDIICNYKEGRSQIAVKKEHSDKSVQFDFSSKLKGSRKKNKQSRYKQLSADDGDKVNMHCPPPLFINWHDNQIYNGHKKHHRKKKSHTSAKNFTSSDSVLSEVEPYAETLQPTHDRSNIFLISKNVKVEAKKMSGEATSGLVGNMHCNGEIPYEVPKLPLLSALSAEILKFAHMIEKYKEKDGHASIADIFSGKEIVESLNGRESHQNLKIEKDLSDKMKTGEGIKKAVFHQPTKSPSRNNIDYIQKKTKPLKEDPSENKKTLLKKKKLKYGTTRTQKLRYNLVKQSKQIARNTEDEGVLIKQTNDRDFQSSHSNKENIPIDRRNNKDNGMDPLNGENCNQSKENNISNCQSNQKDVLSEHSIGNDRKTNQPQYSAKEHDTMMLDSLEVFIEKSEEMQDQKQDLRKVEELPEELSRSNDGQLAIENPGFYILNDVSSIRISDLGDIVDHQHIPSRMKKKKGGALLSGSEEYANDTFSSEDTRSDFAASRTSSISIPLSDSSQTSLSQHSNSRQRATMSAELSVNLPIYPMVSGSSKSSQRSSRVHFMEEVESDRDSYDETNGKVDLFPSRGSGAPSSISKSSPSKNDYSYRSTYSSYSPKSKKIYHGIKKIDPFYQAVNQSPSKRSEDMQSDMSIIKEASSLSSDISARNIGEYNSESHSKTSAIPQFNGDVYQQDETSHIRHYDSLCSNEESQKLAANSSTKSLQVSSFHSSKNHSQFSELPDAPASRQSLKDTMKEIDRNFTDTTVKTSAKDSVKQFDRNLVDTSSQISGDTMHEIDQQLGDMSTSQQISGDTMNEIDKLLREYSHISDGSSVLIPTDEFSQISPDGSPLHKFPSSNKMLRTFDKQSNDAYISQFSTEAFPEGGLLPRKSSPVSKDSSGESIGNQPKKSAFSPHQSKHFRKKR